MDGVDALDMGRAARQLFDELGWDRSADLIAALAERCWPSRDPIVVDGLKLCGDCHDEYGVRLT